jgi:hypothetical protein
MFPHRNVPDGKTHNQIDHILIDKRWHSGVLDVRYIRGADCDTDHSGGCKSQGTGTIRDCTQFANLHLPLLGHIYSSKLFFQIY